MRPPKNTPWGASDYEKEVGEGVWEVGTPSHGGYWISAERLAEMPATLRLGRRQWFEEDCEWSRVALAFPLLFPGGAAKHAELTLRSYYPDDWEKWYGKYLKPGESHQRDEEVFYREHSDNLICFSAVNSKARPGYVEVSARRGGREGRGSSAVYLVLSATYRANKSGQPYLVRPGDRLAHAAEAVTP